MNCEECNMVYIGETEHTFENSLLEHTTGEGATTMNSLYARYFLKTVHAFTNPLEHLR